MAGRPTGYAVSLAGYARKPQTTAGHTAEHGRTDSKTAEHQCVCIFGVPNCSQTYIGSTEVTTDTTNRN